MIANEADSLADLSAKVISCAPTEASITTSTMCAYIDKLRYIGRGAKRSPRVLLMGVILVLCVVAHFGLFKIQLQTRRTHKYYETQGNKTAKSALVNNTLNDEYRAGNLLDEFLPDNQVDNDKNPVFEEASSSLQQRASEDFMLPTRPRAGNQILYKKDSIKRLDDIWVRDTLRDRYEEIGSFFSIFIEIIQI